MAKNCFKRYIVITYTHTNYINEITKISSGLLCWRKIATMKKIIACLGTLLISINFD